MGWVVGYQKLFWSTWKVVFSCVDVKLSEGIVLACLVLRSLVHRSSGLGLDKLGILLFELIRGFVHVLLSLSTIMTIVSSSEPGVPVLEAKLVQNIIHWLVWLVLIASVCSVLRLQEIRSVAQLAIILHWDKGSVVREDIVLAHFHYFRGLAFGLSLKRLKLAGWTLHLSFLCLVILHPLVLAVVVLIILLGVSLKVILLTHFVFLKGYSRRSVS